MSPTDGTSIAARLERVRARVAAACASAGRATESVRVLAVSKFHPESAIREAYACGQRDFAENYVQEAHAKITALKDLNDLRWHFIGRLQSNKARKLDPDFVALHAIDRLSVARELTGARKIFLQYNVAGEMSKAGVGDFAALAELFGHIDVECPEITIQGLMTMPPLDQPAAPYFTSTAAALEKLGVHRGRHPLNELSMGTSADFALAIAAGATSVRLGTDIFGPRA